MWIQDPDGVRIAVVEVPEDHPIRRRVQAGGDQPTQVARWEVVDDREADDEGLGGLAGCWP